MLHCAAPRPDPPTQGVSASHEATWDSPRRRIGAMRTLRQRAMADLNLAGGNLGECPGVPPIAIGLLHVVTGTDWTAVAGLPSHATCAMLGPTG